MGRQVFSSPALADRLWGLPSPLFRVFWDYPPTYDRNWEGNVKMGKRLRVGFNCLRLGLAPRLFEHRNIDLQVDEVL